MLIGMRATGSGFRQAAGLVALMMLIFGVVPNVNASFIPSNAPDSRAADMVAIQKALEIKQVESRLEALGYGPEEIEARLGQLSDEEIHSLATRIEALTTGGDALGVLISVLVIVVLVLVILKLLDKDVVIR